MFFKKSLALPTPETALKGRADPIPTARHHFLSKRAQAPRRARAAFTDDAFRAYSGRCRRPC